jgi:ribokinase
MNEIPSILVIGSINMDLVLETDRIPFIGESLFGRHYQYFPGGKGANQAVAAARLWASVSFAGKIGKDFNGIKLKEKLMAEGIDIELLIEEKNSPTGLAIIILEENGQNRILVYPGANMDIHIEEVKKAFRKNYDAVMLQLEIPHSAIIEVCNIAKRKDIPIVLDTGPATKFPLEKIKGVEIITPNETEVLSLTGIDIRNLDDAKIAAKIIARKAEAKNVVIKMGKKGAFLYRDGQTKLFPSFNVKVVDTTAAGDAFASAMTVSYLRYRDIEKAIHFGNIVGALSVTKLGAQTSLPNLSEVKEFIEERNIKW